MKVGFTLDPGGEGGGSTSFARVLARGLPAHGVELVRLSVRRCDAVLVFAHCGSKLGLRYHRLRGARLVHRLDERIDPGEDAARAEKHARLLALNALCATSIFQSAFVAKNLGARCRAPERCVIHNGVDTALFSPSGDRAPLDGSPRVLHVTWSVGESKRLDRIPELLAALPATARLYLVGRHRESATKGLDDPRVAMLGPRGSDEVARLMRSADLLFFPSEGDPCPNTILEAMASGLPALYHASGGTVELVGDCGVALDGPLDAALARALDSRSTLSQRARERAIALFRAEDAVARYAAALRGERR